MKSPFTGENEAGVDLVLIQSFQRYFVNYVSYANQHFFKQNVHKKRNQTGFHLGFIICGRSPELPKATSLLEGSAPPTPEIF